MVLLLLLLVLQLLLTCLLPGGAAPAAAGGAALAATSRAVLADGRAVLDATGIATAACLASVTFPRASNDVCLAAGGRVSF